MKITPLLFSASIFAATLTPLFAFDPTSTDPFLQAVAMADHSTLNPGEYVVALTPAPNRRTASAIKDRLDAIKEIKSIKVDRKESLVRFTVKPNTQVATSRIEESVKAVSPQTQVGDAVSAD